MTIDTKDPNKLLSTTATIFIILLKILIFIVHFILFCVKVLTVLLSIIIQLLNLLMLLGNGFIYILYKIIDTD